MDDVQKDDFNLQIRKILKEFGVRAHRLVQKRFDTDRLQILCSLNT